MGADRRLAEYDLAASGPGAGLVLGQLQELMPEACQDVPTAGEWRGGAETAVLVGWIAGLWDLAAAVKRIVV